MKISKVCFFLLVVSISSPVLAGPALGVGGAENLSRACPIKSPSACPTGRSCPNCSSCAEPSQCLVCTEPSPSPSDSPQCKVYQLDFKHITSPQRKTGTTTLDQTKAQDLDCFTELYKSIVPSHNPGSITKTTGGVTNYLWKALMAKVGREVGTDYEKNKEFIKCTGKWQSPRADRHNGHMMIGGGQVGGDKGRKTPGCDVGSFVMNDKCEVQPKSSVADLLRSCDLSYLKLTAEVATPISLVWSDSYKTQASTLVNFKLNPHSDNNTWLWRGSEALPLLVYDPEHTGVITSATQLFGSWTFGGNGLASLVEGSEYGTPWRDGYEALSKMDKDIDGKVSGEELKDIALWFDKNQDGISQEGEVKTLSEVAVTALYYKADKKEAGAIVASKGYEREVDGKTLIASSMDWYEKGLKDGFDIMLEGLNLSNQSNTPKLDNVSDHAKDVAPEISGAWAWSLDLPAKGAGFFSFDTTEDGILGASLSRVGISGLGGVASQVMFSHFEATATKNSEGQAEIKFTVDGGEGAILTNTASLSKDGSQLIGKTVVAGSSLSASGTYEYSWKAERVK